MYQGTERVRLVKQEDLEGNRFHRIYEREYARDIWLVKWHSHGLLELRLPTDAGMSRKAYSGYLAMLWKAIEPAIKRIDFAPLCLANARKRLVAKAPDNRTQYRIPNASFKDHQAGTATFDSADGEDSLDESKDRQTAIAQFDDCQFLVVFWLNQTDDERRPEKLRTEIGTFFTNELRIGAGTTPEAVQYVTNRLLELSR
jgi:hypothetical protein